MIEIDHSTWVPPQDPETGPVPTLGPKKPEDVLAYYEGPLTMTLAVDGSLHLLHCLDDPVDRLLYFAAPTTAEAITDMLAVLRRAVGGDGVEHILAVKDHRAHRAVDADLG